MRVTEPHVGRPGDRHRAWGLSRIVDGLSHERPEYERHQTCLETEISSLYDKNELLLAHLGDREASVTEMQRELAALDEETEGAADCRRRLLRILGGLQRIQGTGDPKGAMDGMIGDAEGVLALRADELRAGADAVARAEVEGARLERERVVALIRHRALEREAMAMAEALAATANGGPVDAQAMRLMNKASVRDRLRGDPFALRWGGAGSTGLVALIEVRVRGATGTGGDGQEADEPAEGDERRESAGTGGSEGGGEGNAGESGGDRSSDGDDGKRTAAVGSGRT